MRRSRQLADDGLDRSTRLAPPHPTTPSQLHTTAKRLEEEAAAEKAKADAALAAAASSDSDSDSEEDDSDDSDQEGAASKGGGAAKPQQPATKLPSALELLETVEAPSFLSVPAHQPEFDVQPMQAPVRQPRWAED